MKNQANLEKYITDICDALNAKGFKVRDFNFGEDDPQGYKPFDASFYIDCLKKGDAGSEYLLNELMDQMDGHKGYWKYVDSLGLINRGMCPRCGVEPIDNYFTFTVYGYKTYLCKDCHGGGREQQLKNRNCYVASMYYGNQNTDELVVLRRYRDAVLIRNYLGKIFVSSYYLISPMLIRILVRNPKIGVAIKRFVVEPFVKRARRKLNEL